MKRIIIGVLMLTILLLNTFAIAEEGFSLHSGVLFGMTKEEVFQTEQNNGFTAEENDSDLRVEGTIASIDNSSITYCFNEEGKLYKAIYYLPDYLDRGDFSDYLRSDTMKSFFTTVNNMLIDKYGIPECGTLAEKYYKIEPITGKKDTYIEEINRNSKNIEIVCEQWLVKMDDETGVLIEEVFYARTFTGAFGKGTHYIPRLQYVFCDEETTRALTLQNSSPANDL